MVSFERPGGLTRPGRWAVEAHEVVAEEERPIRAVRRGRIGGDIMSVDWRSTKHDHGYRYVCCRMSCSLICNKAIDKLMTQL